MKRQKDMTLKYELPRSVGAEYATREEQRNNSRWNEEDKPKLKQHPVVDVSIKKEYCIKTWKVRSVNQVKLEVIKQEMTRVNIIILKINELKCTGIGKFNSDDHYIYYCEQKSLEEME